MIESTLKKPLGIRYINGTRIRRAMVAGIQTVIEGQEHLNKINVYPVADGDTGTNMALTMSSVLGTLRRGHSQHADQMLTSIADAALDGARGNSGAILAQFFQGVSDAVYGLRRLTTQQFADAVKTGEQYARDALTTPMEGTVLTVMRDFADHLLSMTKETHKDDFVTLFSAGLHHAKTSLAGTTEQLEALRKAGVVDAGAEGFVRFLDGINGYIKHGDVNAAIPAPEQFEIEESEEHMAGEAVDLEYRYCTECMVTGASIERRKLREKLSAFGASLVFAGTHKKVKIHIHVNDPGKVFELAAEFGTVSGEKADDMHQQQELSHHKNQQVVVATDSISDLPEDILEELNIHMIPVRLHFGEESYLDKVSITSDEFYEKLDSHTEHPKTSQPSPGEFRRNFEYLASHYESVLSVTVTSGGSGTYQAACNAASRSKQADIHVFDSKLASVGQALMTIHAAECAQQNLPLQDIVQQLENARQHTNVYGLIPELTYAVRGGRVKPIVKKIADFFHLVPIFSFSDDGVLKTRRLLPGKSQLATRLAKHVSKQLAPGGRYRIAIAYGKDKKRAQSLIDVLAHHMRARDCHLESHFMTTLGSALGAHAGPQCLVVAVQRRDL